MFEQFMGSFGGGLGKSLGGDAPAVSTATGSLNSSGWVVNLRGSQIGASASPTTTALDPAAVAGLSPMQAGGGSNALALALIAGAAVIWFLKRKRG